MPIRKHTDIFCFILTEVKNPNAIKFNGLSIWNINIIINQLFYVNNKSLLKKHYLNILYFLQYDFYIKHIIITF